MGWIYVPLDKADLERALEKTARDGKTVFREVRPGDLFHVADGLNCILMIQNQQEVKCPNPQSVMKQLRDVGLVPVDTAVGALQVGGEAEIEQLAMVERVEGEAEPNCEVCGKPLLLSEGGMICDPCYGWAHAGSTSRLTSST